MGLKSRESILFTQSGAILDESELKGKTEEKQKGCKGRGGGMEEKTAYPVACSLRKVAGGLVLGRKVGNRLYLLVFTRSGAILDVR